MQRYFKVGIVYALNHTRYPKFLFLHGIKAPKLREHYCRRQLFVETLAGHFGSARFSENLTRHYVQSSSATEEFYKEGMGMQLLRLI